MTEKHSLNAVQAAISTKAYLTKLMTFMSMYFVGVRVDFDSYLLQYIIVVYI